MDFEVESSTEEEGEAGEAEDEAEDADEAEPTESESETGDERLRVLATMSDADDYCTEDASGSGED